MNGTITSPNWPKKYSANQECLIELTAAQSRRIEISFEYFLLEKSPTCVADFVEVLDRNGTAGISDNGEWTSSCGNEPIGVEVTEK